MNLVIVDYMMPGMDGLEFLFAKNAHTHFERNRVTAFFAEKNAIVNIKKQFPD